LARPILTGNHEDHLPHEWRAKPESIVQCTEKRAG
jgi:hypothetical protein